MHSRAAKNMALKAIKSSNLNDEDIEVIESEKAYTVPVVTQNAPEGFSLDLFKQYKRRIEFCDRDIIKIHDKLKNNKEKGSEDKGLIYVDFNADMFEALKQNFMNCIIKSFNGKLLTDPKIEYYGDA